jgi:hypothetical protein
VAAALVQLRFGDPDLAVGAADSAIRIFLGRSQAVKLSDDLLVHVNYLAEALVVAELVHGVHGRADISRAAGSYLRQMIPRSDGRSLIRAAVEAPTGCLVGDRTPLSSTLADALAGTREAELAREITLPAVDCAITVPSERCSVQAAQVIGVRLARVVAASSSTADKLRLGLEAHWLLAASDARTGGLRFGFGDSGVEWMRALRACATLLEEADEALFALDLMSWAAGLAQRLTPFAIKSTTAREIGDCFEQHARLLEESGDAATARQAREAAKQLRRVFPHPG